METLTKPNSQQITIEKNTSDITKNLAQQTESIVHSQKWRSQKTKQQTKIDHMGKRKKKKNLKQQSKKAIQKKNPKN